MIRITKIEPEYNITQDNEIILKDYIVTFELVKKQASNGDVLKFSGNYTFVPDEFVIDLAAIKGRILYSLKNITG